MKLKLPRPTIRGGKRGILFGRPANPMPGAPATLRAARVVHPILYRLRAALMLFILALVIGVAGHAWFLKLGLIDALYVTVITIATVGYGDIVPRDGPARVFEILYVLGGFAVGSYSLSVLIRTIVEGELQGELGEFRMQNKIDRLRDHIILCGFGRIGAELAAHFALEPKDFVVIDRSAEAQERCAAEDYLFLKGDATEDEALMRAGIERARFVIPALASDVDNLFIVISARQLNPRLTIIARATDAAAETKMQKAGADRVMRPLHLGAQRLAQAVLRPTALEFIHVTGGSAPQAEYTIEEALVVEGSQLAGKSLIESNLRRDFEVVLIGIKRADGGLVFNPSGETVICVGDTLVAMGNDERLRALKLLGHAAPSTH